MNINPDVQMRLRNNERFLELYRNDPIVHNVIASGGSEIDCMELLIERNNELFKRLLVVEQLKPQPMIIKCGCSEKNKDIPSFYPATFKCPKCEGE